MSRRTLVQLTTKEALTELSRTGPNGVQHGDLSVVGMPGVVFTPRVGMACPVLVFGHGWLQPTRRYVSLFRHLASWGIVVVAPAARHVPFTSHELFADELIAALDLASKVRLGNGEIRVAADRLAVGGHSIGASCAVLAAASDSRVRAVITLSAAETRPSAVAAASHCVTPSLHLAAGEDFIAPPVGNAEPIAKAWAGPTQLRTLAGADHLGVTDGWHWSELLLFGKGSSKTLHVTKALVAAFLLQTLCNERRYEALLDNDVRQASLDYRRDIKSPVVTDRVG